VPEDYLPEIVGSLKANGSLQATAIDRSNTMFFAVGRLSILDNSIDTTTGMVKGRAEFDNKDWKLFPNQFVNIQLLVNTDRNVITIPTAAVQTGAAGPFVYLLKQENRVVVRNIVLGPSEGGMVEVKTGLDAGDKVVVDGSDRLRDGAEVRIAEGAPASGATAPAKPGSDGSQPENVSGIRKRSANTAPESNPMRPDPPLLATRTDETANRHESFANFHSAPGRHNVVDGRDTAWRPFRV